VFFIYRKFFVCKNTPAGVFLVKCFLRECEVSVQPWWKIRHKHVYTKNFASRRRRELLLKLLNFKLLDLDNFQLSAF
jgi:hypothetical protein